MDGRQKPEPQPTTDNDVNDDLGDDQIIDLNQIVHGDDDDDIIDLTNILEQPERAPEAGKEPNETAMASMDTIATPTDTGESEDTDNDIIDLMDVAAADTPQQDAPAPPAADREEEVIDLMDVAAADTPQQDAPAPPAADQEEEVIDLMDAGGDGVEPLPAEAEAVVDGHDDPTAVDSGDEPAEQMEAMAGPEDERTPVSEKEIGDEQQIVEPASQAAQAGEPSGDQGAAREAVHAATLASVISPSSMRAGEPVPLTDQQVEDALEAVIEKIYGERIEQLLIQTIEKTVKQEIEKIKTALLEDGDDQER